MMHTNQTVEFGKAQREKVIISGLLPVYKILILFTNFNKIEIFSQQPTFLMKIGNFGPNQSFARK